MYSITLKYSNEYLNDLSDEDLSKMLENAIKSHFDIRSQTAIFGHAKHPDLFKKVKKDIARMKTIINKRRQR